MGKLVVLGVVIFGDPGGPSVRGSSRRSSAAAVAVVAVVAVVVPALEPTQVLALLPTKIRI